MLNPDERYRFPDMVAVVSFDHPDTRLWRRTIATCHVLLITALLSITQQIFALDGPALASDVEVQGPWAYKHQFDATHRIEFLATTRAEDADIFLVLGCSTTRIVMSFIYLDHFPYLVPERGNVTVQFNQSDPILLSTAVIDQKISQQILRPREI
jgi:hypothetical protein